MVSRWPRFSIHLLLGTIIILFIALVSDITFQWASIATAKYWQTHHQRLPSRVLGQGAVGTDTVVNYVNIRFNENSNQTLSATVPTLLVGDSVFASNHGAAYPGYPSGGEMFHHQIPDSLLIAQEGWEPADLAFILERILAIPSIYERKPRLVVTYDFKYFLSGIPFTPSFTTQVQLCGEPAFAIPEEIRRGLCAYWKQTWPKVYQNIFSATPHIARSFQSQFDFFSTFFQRIEIYGLGNARLGQAPFRTFTPGFVDAKRTENEMSKFNQGSSYALAAPHGIAGYIQRVVDNFEQPKHPKHLGTFALREVLKRWPNLVDVIYFHPGPQTLNVIPEELRRRLEQQESSIQSELIKAPQVSFHPVREFLSEARDFQDIEHPNIQGHRKMAEFINQLLKKAPGNTGVTQ